MGSAWEQGQLPSFLFPQAVRERIPVWLLEEMRKMRTFYWEEDREQQAYTPAEALTHAIKHDHQDYARHLLDQFPESALAMPGQRFCACPPSAPHLGMAIRHGRRDIINLILQAGHKTPSLRSYINRRGCTHVEDGKAPLHLTCELLDADVATMLLGNGASAHAEDHNRMTPLDHVLEQLRTSAVNARAKKVCLERLLMFMPELRFKMKRELVDDPQYWTQVLGQDNYEYLVGRNPAALLMIAMQRTLAQLPRRDFATSLDELSIPTSLKLLTNPKARKQQGPASH